MSMGSLQSRLQANKDNLCIVHYACTDIRKLPVQIPCIIVADYVTRDIRTFSTIDLGDEKSVLTEFYRYLQDYPSRIVVGWNLKDTIFGLPVIERRYTEVVGGTPLEIKRENVIDLDDTIEEVHGKLYVDHGPKGKMHNLLSLNGISTLTFMHGKDEAKCCGSGDIRSVELSTSCKVRGIMDVLDLFLDGRLRTTRTIARWSKMRQMVHKIMNSTIFWVIVVVGAFVGLAVGILSLLGWLG